MANLEDGNPWEEEALDGQDVNGRHDDQQQLELVNRSREKSFEPEAQNFEDDFLKF